MSPVARLRLIYRIGRVALHVLFGMTVCALLFPWLGYAARAGHIRRWSKRLMGICGVTVTQQVAAQGALAGASGAAMPAGVAALARAMVVANHVSWLDIFVINSIHPCRFVAKAEIRGWPMLGWLAGKAGTLFIARGSRRDLRELFSGLVEKLQRGERIAFFPEGTTAAQGQLLPFHPNLFEAAIDAKVPVQPYAVAYVDAAGRRHPEVDFIGDTSFAHSLVAILSGPPVQARLVCLPALETDGQHRRDLAQAAYLAVAGALGVSPAAADAGAAASQ